jgi:hypothetical protein
MAKKNSYKILGNIYRGKEKLSRGSVVELSEEEAKLYGTGVEKVDVDVIEKKSTDEKPVKKSKKPTAKKTTKKAKEVKEDTKEVKEESKE